MRLYNRAIAFVLVLLVLSMSIVSANNSVHISSKTEEAMSDVMSLVHALAVQRLAVYANKACTLTGRAYMDAETTINLVTDYENLQTKTDANGNFSFTFSTSFTQQSVEIITETNEKMIFTFDLSGLFGLFNLNPEKGYQIHSVIFEQEEVIIKGSHSGGNNGDISLKAVREGSGEFMAFAQGASDENGHYTLAFGIEPETAVLSLKTDGLDMVSCPFYSGDFAGDFTVNDKELKPLLTRLNTYADALEQLIAACQLDGLTTDYETANLEIIKKFIENIEEEVLKSKEAELDFAVRFGQYDFALTKIYQETAQAMQGYINGEKTPLSVPRFVMGDITFDGTSIVAATENQGVIEQRPVFFNGYGHFDTARENVSFFPSIGANIIHTEAMMNQIVTPYNPNIVDQWDLYQGASTRVLFETTEEQAFSGKRSLRIENPHEYSGEPDTYRHLQQKVRIKPKTTYEYGLRAMGGASENILILIRNIKDEKTNFILSNGSGNWQNYSYVCTTGDTDTELEFSVFVNDKVASMYLDDLFLREEGTEKNLLKNPGFENSLPAMSALEREGAEKGYYFRRTELAELGEFLKTAEENNVLVDLAFSHHNFPQFIYELYPEITANQTIYMPFTLDDTRVREIISLYSRVVLEVAANYDCVKTVCITNEPQVRCYEGEYFVDEWQQFLQNKYGDISALNAVYGESYCGFDEVEMPAQTTDTPIFYDYTRFSFAVLEEYLEWLSSHLKEEYPQFMYYAKTMSHFKYYYRNDLKNGSDQESIADGMDLNGCDTLTSYGDHTPLTATMAWYDYMTSLKNAPVWDTEAHVYSDDARTYRFDASNMTFEEEPYVSYYELGPAYTSAYMWNGAMHGRGGSILWLWEMNEFGTPWDKFQNLNANFAFRPADVALNAKAMLDLNRLSKEVTAIAREMPKVGLLYSRTSLVYAEPLSVGATYNSDTYTQLYTNAYEDIIFSGQKVGFVTDATPEDMHKYELLVVPGATHVSNDMLTHIKTYLENGGEVLLLGTEDLQRDEYNRAHDANVLKYIQEHADTSSTVTDKIQSMNLSDVVLIDTETGKKAEGIEWSYVRYGNQFLVNVLNYEERIEKTVALEVCGKRVDTFTELRSNETIHGTYTVASYEPILLSFDIFTFDLLDQDGDVLEENINTIKEGTIRCNAEVGGTVILALYKDDEIVKVSLHTKEIEIDLTEAGNYCLKAMAWDMDTLTPLTKARTITMEVGK